MKKTLLLALLFVAISASAQNETGSSSVIPGRTSFFAEVGGPGILFSANIDTRFKPGHLGWGGRIGLGFVTADENKDDGSGYPYYEPASVVTVPVQVNYIFGKSSSPHTFEAGAGFTYMGRKLEILNFYDDRTSNFFGTASFMYRRQPVNGGFTWRIGFTPLIAKGYIQPLGAASVGYNF
ncbi:hypothetical protein OCK74_15490 [Chitinophagaceae bacterium LB-8]|uniref:Outer membrane protein beta-barrel domain-containing protein n=1 Tax=Paraflavisolibacter caeni TaxID=2982496 RepID=A0A9X3B920_9BACT|nr:hypothetical protein [Paraflavisolibacter caeni]MCU7550521.1 hypothetical protein [Paraflavisolibacter caeni]